MLKKQKVIESLGGTAAMKLRSGKDTRTVRLTT